MAEMIEKPWYEDPFIQGIMGLMGARAMRSIMSGFKANLIYAGENGMKDAARYLDKSLHDDEKRILVIADSFTQKFFSKIEAGFKKYNFEFKIWDGCIPEVPYETIEEGVKICEEFKPSI
ncbi:MAG: iron-containing alcohol dehydrogenase, partial [Candidatus Heimdallarchaeota archaeon]